MVAAKPVKLVLNRETLQRLSEVEQAQVQGGIIKRNTDTCKSCPSWGCPPNTL